jgi:hypothetical protein
MTMTILEQAMNRKLKILAVGALIVSAATVAVAQTVANLSGTYRCIENCAGPGPAFVTQNGWELNITNEAGVPTRAWIDWPGHIWAQNWNEGAVYSPDGVTIQFDRGSIWQRIVGQPGEAIAYCMQRFKSYDPGSGTYLGYDGLRHPCP